MKERIQTLLKKIDTVNPDLFSQPEEKILWQTMKEMTGTFGDADGLLDKSLTVFFDRVLVLDPDPAIRQNRINLLRYYLKWDSSDLC